MTLDTLINKLQDFRNQAGKDIPVLFYCYYRDSDEGKVSEYAGFDDFEFINKNRLIIEVDTEIYED